jgi:carbonic anhydrase/acetyltransferase-like protein (isoleucine patch superfamily)
MMRLASEWLAIAPDADGWRTDAEGHRVYIHPEAHIGSGVGIGAGSHIGERALIGPGARIGERALIGAGSRIGARAIIGAEVGIGAGARIGSGARITATRDLLVVGPCGSRMDMLTVYRSRGVTYCATGCFCGTWDEFAARVTGRSNDSPVTDRREETTTWASDSK